jgi:hypothetical protein
MVRKVQKLDSVYFGETQTYSTLIKQKINCKKSLNNVAELSGVKLIYKTIYQNQDYLRIMIILYVLIANMQINFKWLIID